MAFFGVMGKWLAGSGFADILIRSGITTYGCGKSIMKGSNVFGWRESYDIVPSVIEKLFIEQFVEAIQISGVYDVNIQDLFNQCRELLKNTRLILQYY